jgi:hypothetical protein
MPHWHYMIGLIVNVNTLRADKLLGDPKLVRHTMEYVNEINRLK